MKKFLSILLAVMMILSTVSFAAPSAVVVDDSLWTVPETDASLSSEDDTATLADVSDYGTLLFNLDFENTAYPDKNETISNCGAVKSYTSQALNIPSAFGDNADTALRLDVPANITGSYATVNGSNVMTVTGSQYPQFNIKRIVSESNWSTTAMPDGYYTIVADYAKDSANEKTGVVQARIPNKGGKAIGTSTNLRTTMQTITTTIALSTNEGVTTYVGNGTTHADTFTNVFGVGVYFGTSATTDKYYVDNFKLYWKPLTVKATINVGDNKFATGGTYDVSTNGVTVAELGAYANNTNYSYSVKSATVNGTTYTGDTKIYLSSDSEITLTWEKVADKWYDEKYGTMVFDITMDKNTAIPSSDLVTAGTVAIKDYLHPNIASFSDADYSNANKYFMRATNFAGAEIVKEGDNYVLKMMNPTNARCGFEVNTWDSSNVFVKRDDITYSLVYDVKQDYANGNAINVTDRFIYQGTGEATGVENKDNTIGQWHTNVTTFSAAQAGDRKTSEVKAVMSITYGGSSTQSAHTYYYDNVRLYFKPQQANVTLTSDCKNLTLPATFKASTSGVLASELVKDVTYDDDYTITGVKVGDKTYALTETVYFAADVEVEVLAKQDTDYVKTWTDSEKGVLLFNLNFDKDNTGASVSAGTFNYGGGDAESLRHITLFGSVNPKIEKYSNVIGTYLLATAGWTNGEFAYDSSISSNTFVGTANGSGFPQINFTTAYALRNNNDIVKDTSGVFTLEHTWKDESGMKPTYRFNGYSPEGKYNASGDTDFGATVTSVDLGNGYTKYTVTVQKPKDSSVYFDNLKIHVSGTPASGKKTYIDDIKLYYKPEAVNVTIKGGANTSFVDQTISVSTKGVKVSDLVEKISDIGYGRVTGLKNGDKTLGMNDVLVLAKDTELTATWAKWNVIEGYDYLEFNTDMNRAGLETGTANVKFDWGSYGDTRDTGVAGKDTPSSQGNIYSAVSAKNGSFVFDLPTVFEHTATDGTRFTFKTPNLKAGQVKGMLMKLRYTNLPNFVDDYETCEELGCVDNELYSSDNPYEHKFYNQNDATKEAHEGTFTTKGVNAAEINLHFASGNAWSGSLYAGKKVDITEGTWMTYYVDFETISGWSDRANIDYFYVDPMDNMWNGMKMEIDYIRLIGEEATEYAPTTLPESTNMRISTPQGVRFMASLSTEEQSKASAYGWIVTRNALTGALGIANADFTIENADAKGLNYRKGYAYGGGVTTPIIFNEDDTTVYFTAVLYGIPDNMYNDILIARPFTVIDGTTYYGEVTSASVNSIVTKIAEGGYVGLTDAQKEYIKNIYDNMEQA